MESLLREFAAYDPNGTGEITVPEFKSALRTFGITDGLSQLVAKFAVSGSVNYRSFMTNFLPSSVAPARESRREYIPKVKNLELVRLSLHNAFVHVLHDKKIPIPGASVSYEVFVETIHKIFNPQTPPLILERALYLAEERDGMYSFPQLFSTLGVHL
eukprot:TRINITY_DN19431_c0_g1_i1.p1 TRINITY_DN19431_c0_g1~~TRINITY_DN19431_c0_g1_i1.p1  ORF type:complete len:158 (+),score=14.85 TRINITY_DN19431_c0_g1_i1:34-507(+)